MSSAIINCACPRPKACSLRVIRVLILSLVLVAMMSVATAAYGYDETSSGRTCVECHGTGDDTSIIDPASGPHGGYRTTTSKCATCHTVHAAPADGILLLPEATIKATCEVCHDGTAGGGVYGVVFARTGAPAASQHRVIDTDPGTITTIPGGGADGTDATFSFTGAGGNLTCTDCHSPHGSSVVDAFTGDRARSELDGSVLPSVAPSARLLKQRPTSMSVAAADVTVYGSDWCGACHIGRLSGSGPANNHPVESSANPPLSGIADLFYYERVARAGEATIIGTMGRTNAGYVMPDPRIVAQDGHNPICQQCHEDARDVLGAFTLTAVDGLPGDASGGSTDNPRFQTFPHESPTLGLLVSDWRDSNFCMSCHSEMP